MVRKIRLIYDATILRELKAKTSNRTGVYSVGYHVLMELLKDERFEIVVYSAPDAYLSVKRALESNELSAYELHMIESVDRSKVIEKVFARYTTWWESLIELPRWKRRAYKGITLPIYLLESLLYKEKGGFTEGYDIFFTPTTTDIPEAVMKDSNIKKIVFLHDTMPIRFREYYPKGVERKYPIDRLIEQLRSPQSDIYGFANSEQTKRDFMEMLPPRMEQRICVTMLGCGERFQPVRSSELANKARLKYNIPQGRSYIFSLCTLEPRKNLIRAVSCFIEFIKKHDITDLYFVLGGAHWYSFIHRLEDAIDGFDEYKKYIIRAGYVDDEDLPVLYSDAMWFVYTSQYEGFGIPPLEAMSCGCPVITSNNSSLPEVVGDAGIMVDWDSDTQHVEAYERYYYDEKLREEMSKRGVERAKSFTWDKIGKGIADRLAELATQGEFIT